MAHPWMKSDLSHSNKLLAQGNLKKYVSVRKEKSKKYLDENKDDDADL